MTKGVWTGARNAPFIASGESRSPGICAGPDRLLYGSRRVLKLLATISLFSPPLERGSYTSDKRKVKRKGGSGTMKIGEKPCAALLGLFSQSVLRGTFFNDPFDTDAVGKWWFTLDEIHCVKYNKKVPSRTDPNALMLI